MRILSRYYKQRYFNGIARNVNSPCGVKSRSNIDGKNQEFSRETASCFLPPFFTAVVCRCFFAAKS
ncbi:MAG: hypothetical protein LBH00_09985 [Planctomycetaceae bacterium]|jgi:hypothetical protein|nr:hypothetical protein [Planctomycetaceae bacterium]